MNVFYIANAQLDQTVAMEGQEWRHCHRSLRKNQGDIIIVVNGKGGKFKCEILEVSVNQGLVKVLDEVNYDKHLNYRLHIAVPPTKKPARIEWAIEKMTEIGLSEISFLDTRYSERVKIKMERIEKICVSAMKQSLQASLPMIHPVISLKQFLDKSVEIKAEKYIAYVEEIENNFPKNYQKGKDVIVLIGPEGGFSEKEVEQAKEYGFKPVSLGVNRLRTETACLAVCQSVRTLNMI